MNICLHDEPTDIESFIFPGNETMVLSLPKKDMGWGEIKQNCQNNSGMRTGTMNKSGIHMDNNRERIHVPHTSS